MSANLNGVWMKLWPDCVSPSQGRIEEEVIQDVIENVVEMGRQLGFEELEKEDVDGLLESHGEELSNEDLMHLREQIAAEDASGTIKRVPPKALSTKRLSEIFQHINAAIDFMQEDDPNVERSLNVARVLSQGMQCYRELHEEEKRAAKPSGSQTCKLALSST